MIKLENIHKSFGRKKVLNGVNTFVEEGKTTVFIGPSGCGKSTILKIILRLIEADEGNIFIDGQNIVNLKENEMNKIRAKIGMVFQSAALFDSLKIWANVGFALLEREKMNPNEVRKIVSEKLKIVGLSGTEDLYPSELSGGMQKRAAIARAIVQEPKYLFYDEPTTGLDPITSTIIEKMMKDLQVKKGITTIIVTHQHSTIFNTADIITMFNEGKVYISATKEEFLKSNDKMVRDFIEGKIS
jgi:phospholipid/cholesterol/gamma-HCH transport system ATP-binding protein